jgi:hypothetical protein
MFEYPIFTLEYLSYEQDDKFEYFSELLTSGRLYTAESKRVTSVSDTRSIPSNDCLYT